MQKLGDSPRANDMELVYALAGHVRRLVHSGAVSQRVRSSQPKVLEYVRR